MLRTFILLLSGAGCLTHAVAVAVFDYGSSWQHLVGDREASAPDPTEWRRVDYDDSRWASGAAPIGYAAPPNSEPEFNLVTTLPTAQEGNYLSLFLRRAFTVNHPASVTQLTLNVQVDDGFIAWLNGVEVGRYNVPEGELSYLTSALSANEPTLISLPISENLSALLRAGKNVLAVQVFNAGFSSSDLVFDAALEGDLDEAKPIVVDTAPLPGSTAPQLENIAIVFSENVQGVDASDLLINGVPATSLQVISPREYSFGFAQPAPGPVEVAWAANHGIADLSAAQNLFGGGSWTYILDVNAPAARAVISEFLADNERGLRDDNGNRSDWIELFNPGPDPVSLEGWFLSDDAAHPTKWRLPAVSLAANRYLLVWASGNNRTDPGLPLHTNFRLDKDGGHLALADPRTNVISEFAPTYPGQRADISFGRDALDPEILGYFSVPTPGSPNQVSGSGFAPEPQFSRDSGVFTNASLTVTLTASGGQIRYTLDGSVPTATSPLYTSGINLSTTTTLKARVFQSPLLPSAVIAKTYILIDNSVANFRSKLPVIVVSTSGRGIVDHPAPGTARTHASVVAVDTFRGLSSVQSRPDYLGQAGISIRGQTSAGFPKRPYRLELQDAYRNDRDSELFGLPADSDWILNNPYTDKPFLQNFLAQELFEKMGHYAVRRRFIEVFVNTSGGKVSYPRDYAGIYILLEKIKVGNDRVDIERLTPFDTSEPNISGGYMFKKDKDTLGDRNFSTQGGAGFSRQALKIHEPSPDEITPQQFNWLVNYLRQFERALYAPNWRTATGTNHYSHFIDVDSLVDHHWIVEFTKQIDGYRLSNYMQKDRNGKIKMEPIWDWNLSFGNADYLDGWRTDGWYYSLLEEYDHIWLRRLISGTTSPTGASGDPDFNQRIADRWSELRTNVFALTNVLNRVDELAALLAEAADRDFQKWPRLGTYVWPNPTIYITPTTYAGVINAMKNWIRGRHRWIETQFVVPPTYNLPPGRIPERSILTLSGPGSIYYTLDGTDPRQSGGAIAPQAILYSGPIELSGSARLMVRSRSGTKWSGPATATYLMRPVSLAISELMYHPAPPPEGSGFTDEDFEFIEFTNLGSAALDLTGFRIVEGVGFDFPAHTLAPGERALAVKNRAAFESRYGAGHPVLGEFTGQLDNAGETITIFGRWGEVVLTFAYQDRWHPITDGVGFSLVLGEDALPAKRWDLAQSWRASTVFGGSPGQAKPLAKEFPHVVINEALTRPTAGPARVELRNLSPTDANIGGWFFTDDFDRPKRYRFLEPTWIPAGGYLVLSEDDLRPPQAAEAFGLNADGEELWLFSGDGAGHLTGYMHGFAYGNQTPNVTFGRHVTTTGEEHFVAESANTLGRDNSGPAIPAVVIHEIMYHPPDVWLGGVFWNNAEDEYLELFNRSTASVELSEPTQPALTWGTAGEADYSFPPGTVMAPGEFILLVSFDPARDVAWLADFRQKYQVPAGVRIFGPYSGFLNNQGGAIEWQRPEPMDLNAPPILLERIQYANDAPWPSGADAAGFALSRRDPGLFGDDPAHWIAAAPTPGRPNLAASAPVIVEQPLDVLTLANETARLAVAAESPDPLRYQWRFQGANILGATNAALTLANLRPDQSGAYSVVILGLNGAVTSDPAEVLVGTDADGDGMDDEWEWNRGLNPFVAADGAADADQDGFSNWQEYVAGTDTQDPLSYLQVHQAVAGEDTLLTVKTAADRSYTLEFTDSLADPQWQTLAHLRSQPIGRSVSFVDPRTGSGRYYRVISPSRP